MRVRKGSWLVIVAASACGRVSHSDPSLWQTSSAVGDPTYGLTQGSGTGGAGNDMTGGAAGSSGSGGFTEGSGGTQGSGGVVQSSGGFNPGSGGLDGSGGLIQSTGGLGPSNGGETGSGGQASNSGTCHLTFSVTTVTAHGTYAPRNVGAIWIQSSSGAFVKTLEEWGFIRIGNATAWTSVSASNLVDAVTGATRSNHGPLTASWDCTDTSHAPVPDGSYSVHVTFAESDAGFFGGTGPTASVTFTKGSGPVDTTAPDTANFTTMHLTLN